MRIVNNRICYRDHNVVVAPEFAIWDFVLELANSLGEEPTLGQNRVTRRGIIKNSGSCSWTIEHPNIVISNFWTNPAGETRTPPDLPDAMRMTTTLFNGNIDKVIFVGTCLRSDSFLPLWRAMLHNGIKTGKLHRTRVENEYFAQYDAFVKSLLEAK